MNAMWMLTAALLLAGASLLPAHAEQSVSIEMKKSTYLYCEKLFYTITVSEVTGDSAIIHIIDEGGTSSSAIPLPITALQTPVPAMIAFERGVFPPGTYSVDVKYSGAQSAAEFVLVDTDVDCIPQVARTFTASWLAGNISDGFLIDAFQKFVDSKIISIPFEISRDNIHDIDIPEWVKNLALWWISDIVSDEEFALAINYLLDNGTIGPRA